MKSLISLGKILPLWLISMHMNRTILLNIH